MQSTAKAIALARDLKDKLSVRLAQNTSSGLNSVRQAFDAAGWPMLIASRNGNEAEAQPVVMIRIKNVDMVSKDVFGNQTFAYAPHTLEFAYELTSGSAAAVPARADVLVCEYESIKTGVQIQLKEIANGTAVTEASLNAATPVITIDELYWPTKSV